MQALQAKLVTAAAVLGAAVGGGAIANAATTSPSTAGGSQSGAATQQSRPSYPAHGTAAHEALGKRSPAPTPSRPRPPPSRPSAAARPATSPPTSRATATRLSSRNPTARRRRPPHRRRVESINRSVELDIALNELRERRGITQEQVAAQLETSRPNVSRIEREDDVRMTTLQRYVMALGGTLELVVRFPDGERLTMLGAPEQPIAGD